MVPYVTYTAFNKPMGALHWMEHSLNMPQSLSKYSETMFVILDPDQIVLRPFTKFDFTSDFAPNRLAQIQASRRSCKNTYFSFVTRWTPNGTILRYRLRLVSGS
jgi:hypothetical protein